MESQRLFGAICSLHRTLVRQNDVNLSSYGISAVQFHTLIFIKMKTAHGHKVCQRDVEREVGLRPSSVSAMLSNLEKAGFIKRTSSEDDARTKYITLDTAGNELCRKNIELMDKCDEQICLALTEDEQQTLKYLLEKIFNSVQENRH